MTTTTRIYVIHPSIATKLTRDNAYLVRAANRSQALRHIAEQHLACAVADQTTCIDLASQGVAVQNAKPEQGEMT